MKVKELMDVFGKYDLDFDVICYFEDEQVFLFRYFFRLLDFDSVDIVEGERQCDDNGVFSLKIGKLNVVMKYVIFNVIIDC